MRFVSESFGLPDSTFILLRDLIHEHTGVNYDIFNREMLADKLSPRVLECGFDSFLDYYYFLKYDEGASEEWHHVMDAISVPETFFWREIDQIRAVVDVLVPEYFSKQTEEPLRIWSAACATGEEPLTLAMALHERGWFHRQKIEIYASDASPKAILKARSGIYGERSFRNLTPNLQEKYFVPVPQGWRVMPELYSHVKWTVANLMSERDIRYLASAHIIFCRNVFIYFSEKSIRKTVRLFWEFMPTPAYLCVAASESLLKLTTDFQLQEIGGSFIYVKN